MNHFTSSEAANTAASDAAFTRSISPTPGVQETPAAPAPAADMQLAPTSDSPTPTVVAVKQRIPLATIPKTIGLRHAQQRALQALAAGNTVEEAARFANVGVSTVFRWRKYHPAFIAAWNAWLSSTQTITRDLLSTAQAHAARGVLRATEKGDLRACLALLKGLGMLTPQKPGPEVARAVEQQLFSAGQEIKRRMLGDTWEKRLERAELKRKEKRDAAARKVYFERYAQVPPLPRPFTQVAATQAAKPSDGIPLRGDCCSITITAIAGDRALVIDLIKECEAGKEADIQKSLETLPRMLRVLTLNHAIEKTAKEFEALGVTVELRPGWTM